MKLNTKDDLRYVGVIGVHKMCNNKCMLDKAECLKRRGFYSNDDAVILNSLEMRYSSWVQTAKNGLGYE